jgi:biotin carboxylase
VCPSSWDELQLRRLQGDTLPYDIRVFGADVEAAPNDFDAEAFIEATVNELQDQRINGVTSSSDYPGCVVAAFIANALGLPGPQPESILRCSHKYYSRLAQQAAVPEATPKFMLLDPNALDERALSLDFPMFVKPVKSVLSMHSRRVGSFEELEEFVNSVSLRSHLTEFVRPFNQLVSRFEDIEYDGGFLLAEEILIGQQVTLEGLVSGGVTHILGIVDSIMHQGTHSFARFDYPSSLNTSVADRMADISRRAMIHIGFNDGLFNIEFTYDSATDAVHIIQINPRMSGQFADLLEAVNGTNTYALLLALAAGDALPPPRQGGSFSVAASFVRRSFYDAIVTGVPNQHELSAVCSRRPITLVKYYYGSGERLSDNARQFDGLSYRYAVYNMCARSRKELFENFDELRTLLDPTLDLIQK